MIPDREIPFKVSESILRSWNQTTLRRKLLRPGRERLFKMMVTIRIQFDVVVNKQNIVERKIMMTLCYSAHAAQKAKITLFNPSHDTGSQKRL